MIKPFEIPKWLSCLEDIRDYNSAKFLVDKDDQGNRILRQKKAKNEYNPEGITLATVYYELQTRMAELIECLPESERVGIPAREEELFEDGDEARAESIAEQPVILLHQSELQKAVSRWFFAAHHASLGPVRAEGKRLLKVAVPESQGGAPKQNPYTPDSIKIAYRDINTYSEGLLKCIKAAREKRESLDYILKHFPDCQEFFEHVQRESDPDWKMQRTLSTRDILPSKKEMATEYITSVAGIGSKHLHKILTP